MHAPTSTANVPFVRFSLADLLRFVTVIAILLGCIPLTGVPAAGLLTAMALALAAGQGLAAVGLFLAALVGANVVAPRDFPPQLAFTILVGVAVLGWYRFERFWSESRQQTSRKVWKVGKTVED